MKRKSARDRILETAAALFHDRGFSEVGINEIIDKAETAKATFYQHFPSKDRLCEAWLDAIHAYSEERRRDLLELDVAPIEKVDRSFQELEHYMKQSDFRGCPYSNTGAVVDESCSGIREKIEEHKLSIRRFFRALAREIAPSDQRSQKLGDTLFVLYSGGAIEAQNLKTLWPVEAAQAAAREACEREMESA